MFPTNYLTALIDGARRIPPGLTGIASIADDAAARLVAGGALYAASTRPDFISEAYIRSGGLMMLREYDPSDPPGPDDVVIAGWTEDVGPDRELLSSLAATGCFTIGIGPSRIGEVDAYLESRPPTPDTVVRCLGDTDYPITSLQNLALLWTFTGELVAALTRLGRMPVLYQSVLVPGARERNASFGTDRFHLDHAVPRIEPAVVGTAYVEALTGCLERLRAEAAAIDESARLCLDTINRDRAVHAFLISHFPVHQAGAPGDPGHLTPLETFTGETPDLDELGRKLCPGDTFFFLGYYRRPADAYTLARSRGCTIVEVVTGTDQALSGPEPDVAIRPGWPYTDALVDVPGYDIRILPASGIVQTAVFWSVVGRMAELTAGV